MQVLSLCNKDCPSKIPFTLTTELGNGSDGQVFEFSEDPNKVIKLCVLYDNYSSLNNDYSKIDCVIKYIVEHNPTAFAHVFDYKFLTRGVRKTYDGEQEYILYYYIMEKLFKISEDEKRVFHTILSHEDLGIIKKYPLYKVRNMLFGMSKGLDFDVSKVLSFYIDVRNSVVNHLDIHVRNIMKTKDGDFRLIDFDRAEIGE